MHEALYQNMIIEIKNHIHDEILWRIRGTLLSNDEILEDLQQSVKIADAEAQYTDFIGYLPEDYYVSNETFNPVLDMAKPDRLNKQPSSFEKYATQTIERLNEELLEEQKTWRKKTDFDRLFLAVKELKAQGILFNYYDDMKGGLLQTKVEQLISAGDEINAYFYVCDQGIEHSTQNLSNL